MTRIGYPDVRDTGACKWHSTDILIRSSTGGVFVAALNANGERLTDSQKEEVERATKAYQKTWEQAKIKEKQITDAFSEKLKEFSL
jgi:hypothetical protein